MVDPNFEDKTNEVQTSAVKAPETEHILQYFTYEHLREDLQNISKPFCELAQFICSLPRNPERTVALRKLLEAKDAAVRAFLAK